MKGLPIAAMVAMGTTAAAVGPATAAAALTAAMGVGVAAAAAAAAAEAVVAAAAGKEAQAVPMVEGIATTIAAEVAAAAAAAVAGAAENAVATAVAAVVDMGAFPRWGRERRCVSNPSPWIRRAMKAEGLTRERVKRTKDIGTGMLLLR